MSRLPVPLPDPLLLNPGRDRLDADVTVPGSKSITNRALVCAALAAGRSRLGGALDADDVDAMAGALRAVGAVITREGEDLIVDGVGGRPSPSEATLDVRQSGVTSRFVPPLLLLGEGTYTISAHPQMQERPMSGTFEALDQLGGRHEPLARSGFLPARIHGGTRRGGTVRVPGDVSSQFLSGLLLAGPCFDDGLTVQLSTELVSRPYVELTIAVMTEFGAAIVRPDDRTFIVEPTGYRSADHHIEPDASAASYPLAAAAVRGGRVKILGLDADAKQGDARFADVLAQIGATLTRDATGTEIRVEPGTLAGGRFDFGDISDTAPTLACIAPFLQDPVVMRGIGFIRHKEIDRIAAIADGLGRCGIDVTEHPDGWTIRPGHPNPAVLPTHEDHRMAMSFSLLGLVAPGIAIEGPDCVAKTFPRYWELLERLAPGTIAPSSRS